ncbi:DUF7109 family protein [Halomarina pelagica]|uniref:DUF7109 family protein n=1 Tax=Halomarina pelagica TaxID=2961599 RepID=UPI0034A1B819
MSDPIDLDGDDLAGVVDLFGALTREELDRALAELAFKRDADPPDAGVIERALADYELVAHDDRLVPGPAAFPALPEGAADLPHILDVEPRSPDRAAVARAVEERFRAETARALAEGDDDAVVRLLDASYDLEAWGPIDLGDARRRLDDAREP